MHFLQIFNVYFLFYIYMLFFRVVIPWSYWGVYAALLGIIGTNLSIYHFDIIQQIYRNVKYFHEQFYIESVESQNLYKQSISQQKQIPMNSHYHNLQQRHEKSQSDQFLKATYELQQYYSNKKQLFRDQMMNNQNYNSKQVIYPIGKYIGEVKIGSSNVVREGQGIFQYKNGDIYFGNWYNDQFEGYGIYLFESGQKYEGYFRNGLKNQMGTFYYDAISFYNGNWQNDVKNDFGILETSDQYYQGYWQDNHKTQAQYHFNKITKQSYCGHFNHQNKKQGQGKLIMADGSVYVGYFANDLFHGLGELQYVNKDKYNGNFNEGVKHGTGKYFYSEGTVFNGRWANNQKIDGELILFNGDIFRGTFRNNMRYNGKYYYKNGDVYEGSWLNQFKEGKGNLYLHNGESYIGNFQKGHKNGHGLYKWINGDQYQGQFYLDKRQGLGMYVWNQGGFYRGQWSSDRMNGLGRLVKGGIDLIGQFHADHFVREAQVQELSGLQGFILQ